jgi:hypothetical protein
MKFILSVMLFLFGLIGLAMSLCGGIGMLAYARNGGVFIGGAMLVVGVAFIILAVKGIQGLFAPPADPAATAAAKPPDQPGSAP